MHINNGSVYIPQNLYISITIKQLNEKVIDKSLGERANWVFEVRPVTMKTFKDSTTKREQVEG